MQEQLFSTALRVSSTGSQLWTHYDVMDNVLCNIVGRKQVVLWPPHQVIMHYSDFRCYMLVVTAFIVLTCSVYLDQQLVHTRL